MSDAPELGLDEDNRQFVIESASKNYTPREIRVMLKDDRGISLPPATETIKEFIQSDEIKAEIQTKQNIKRKKAEVGEEDLLETLVDLKDDLQIWLDELKNTEHGVTRNEAISNTIDVVNKIGELIGELDNSGAAGNIVKIDEFHQNVEQEFVSVVQHLPKDEKKDIVEQLQDDPEIENFMIEKKDEDGSEQGSSEAAADAAEVS